MSTNNHTAIATSAAANAATFNSPLGELDAVMGDFSTIDVTGSPADMVSAINQNYDDMGDISTTTVAGSPATFVAALNNLQEYIIVESEDETLKAWTNGECWELTSVTYNSVYPDVIASATIKWPDGSAGTLTATTTNDTWQAVDAFTASHTDSGKTVTQTAVTRDAFGQPTTKPAMTVA